ncbi:uncharacterized protein LOC144621047 [Crassostrea virginica]
MSAKATTFSLSQEQFTTEKGFKMATEEVIKGESEPNPLYNCHIHEKSLMPMLCRDCDSSVCMDCLVTTHVGHKLSKILDNIEDKISILNDAIQNEESTCFNLSKLHENIRKRIHHVRTQKEQLIQRVTDREEEIIREIVKNLDLFRKDTDEEMIRCVYFYNALKQLGSRYVDENREEARYTFVTRDISSEILTDLVGSLLTDEQLSSDELIEIYETDGSTNAPCSKEEESDHPYTYQYQQKCSNVEIDAIMFTASKKGLLQSRGSLYQQSYSNVDKVLENIQHFTYAPKSDEIIFTMKGQSKKIWRQYATGERRQTSFMTLSCGNIITIGHDDNNYLNILYEDSYSSPRTFHQRKTYYFCQANDIGCLKKETINLGTKDFSYPFFDFSAIKTEFCNSSIVVFYRNSLSVMKGFSLVELFSYSGCVGNLPRSTFSPKDICTDQDGNFIVIDSYDNTVHLLNRRGDSKMNLLHQLKKWRGGPEIRKRTSDKITSFHTAQWVRTVALQAEGCVFGSQPRQAEVVKAGSDSSTPKR